MAPASGPGEPGGREEAAGWVLSTLKLPAPLPLSAIGVLAILLTAVFLEATEDSESQNEAETQPPRLGSILLSTFKLFRDKRLCLLTLLPMYSGLQQGFLSGEYTRVGHAVTARLVPLSRLHPKGHRVPGPPAQAQGGTSPQRSWPWQG